VSRAVSIPVIHPRVGVTVRVDDEAWNDWLASGRSTMWFWEPGGPRYRDPSGHLRPVADAILGVPAAFADGGSWDLTLANLRPST
jgi:hypothetical protein